MWNHGMYGFYLLKKHVFIVLADFLETVENWRLTVFCKIFCVWISFCLVEHVANEHQGHFRIESKTLFWVNWCKDNHYFDHK